MPDESKTTPNQSAEAFRDILHVLARPVRSAAQKGHVVVQPYRGYGTSDEVFLMGRVFRQPLPASFGERSGLLGDLANILRRMLRWGMGNAVLNARFYGAEKQVRTDRDGYFRIQMSPGEKPPSDQLWHPMELELIRSGGENVRAEGRLFIPPDSSRYVVISDIDDTVVLTGVANKILMMWRLFFQGAKSRTAFPGVGAFYQALHHGRSGNEMNPMLYVSRGPWSIYDVLEAFFNRHGIPVGPILFLREWGLTLQRPLPRRSRGHKRELIREMLSRYEDRQFILIGDSGQHDPDIYTEVVKENPGRVLAIYIRNVNREPERRRAIENLAAEVVESGSSMLLAADTFAMADHAVEHGLISKEAREEVFRARTRQKGEPDLKPTQTIEREEPQEAKEALREGPLSKEEEGTPPNISVESDSDRTTDRSGR